MKAPLLIALAFSVPAAAQLIATPGADTVIRSAPGAVYSRNDDVGRLTQQ